MLIEIKLPQLADGMTTAAITAWLKDVGDSVTKGEPIVEVDIDKTTIELEAPASGVLQDIRVINGTEEVPVGTVLAVIAPAGIDTAVGDTASGHTVVGTAGAILQAEAADSARRPTLKPPPSAGATGSSHQSAGAPAPRQPTPATAAAATTGVAPVSDAVTPVQSPSVVTTKVDASPLARRMAELLGLDLATVRGTGPGGRIRKVDVDRRGSSTP
ncbi:E3 binding domain-containing protein [Flavobacteriaceae bacterium]|nr:E3 binding domain-containing protein [Flavobacteriaceae bacterium]